MVVNLDMTVHDETTLHKVLDALAECGIVHQAAADVITAMQNRGILFRERA
jgi:hypothetical protein